MANSIDAMATSIIAICLYLKRMCMLIWLVFNYWGTDSKIEIHFVWPISKCKKKGESSTPIRGAV